MNRRAPGFTLVELLIVIVVGSVVLGAVYQGMVVQERSNRHQVAIVTTQDNVRAGLDILSNELREISAVKGDLLVAGTDTITFRALRKAGIVCGRDASIARDWVDLAVIGQSFTATDTAVIFDDGTNKASGLDDNWREAAPTNISSPGSVCLGNQISSNIQRLRFPAGTLATVDTGALVRSYKTYEYALVDVAGKGKLIRSRMGVTDTLVESLAPIAENGLNFQYFNSNGTQITNPSTAALRATVMSVRIVVKGKAGGATTASGREFADSLVGQVYLRGNARTN